MAVTFEIPKQTDLQIVAALGRVNIELKPLFALQLQANIPYIGYIDIPNESPESEELFRSVIEVASMVVESFRILDPNQQTVFSVTRQWGKITDHASIGDQWVNSVTADTRGKIYIKLLAAAQKELKVPDVIAALQGHGDDPWNRYRDAQTAVINSLQQTMECLLIKTADRNAELDRTRSEKYEKLEADLRAQLEKERSDLHAKIAASEEALGAREKALEERAAEFNTKEARYVARQKQEEQIKQLKGWIEGWNLTEGTTKKRRPIFWAYITALIVTGALTGFYAYSNYKIFSTTDLSKLPWWQWVTFTAKLFFPFAGFVTFLTYFIRWEGVWARQHADEEFKNRNRLVDLGRSSWLLEAVRDTEGGNNIPPELLKELSRNLFSNTATDKDDIHPTALGDVFLQGLSSIKLKTPGAEMEATRGNGKTR